MKNLLDLSSDTQATELPEELWAYYTYLNGQPFYQAWTWRSGSDRACGVMLFSTPEECERVCGWSRAPMGSGAVAITLDSAVREVKQLISRNHLVPAICLCDGMTALSEVEGKTKAQMKGFPREGFLPKWWKLLD